MTLIKLIFLLELLNDVSVGYIQLKVGSPNFLEVNLSRRHALSLDLVLPQSLDLLCCRPRSSQSCFDPRHNYGIRDLISLMVSSSFHLSRPPNTINYVFSGFHNPISRLRTNYLHLTELGLTFTLTLLPLFVIQTMDPQPILVNLLLGLLIMVFPISISPCVLIRRDQRICSRIKSGPQNNLRHESRSDLIIRCC